MAWGKITTIWPNLLKEVGSKMCSKRDAVQARYDAACGLICRTRSGRINAILQSEYNQILKEPIPPEIEELVGRLEGSH